MSDDDWLFEAQLRAGLLPPDLSWADACRLLDEQGLPSNAAKIFYGPSEIIYNPEDED